jgi:hypothetical protein
MHQPEEEENKYKFKFDEHFWENYAYFFDTLMDGLVEQNPNVWIVYPSTSKTNSSYFVGENNQKTPIYKQAIIVDALNIEYKKHITSNAKHFLKQPHYYKGMFDILN